MDNCGNVRLDRYWNFIATPFFFIIVLFGLYVLFTADQIYFINYTKSDLTQTALETDTSLQGR
jgi:hypothetical protein